VELMQMVVEGQRLLADAMRQLVNWDARHGRQGQEPNQHSNFKDFLDTKPRSLRRQRNLCKLMSG
jgi:hypothetical protein